MQKLDEFYQQHEEPLKSCLQALRTLILTYNSTVTERWYYRLPCFFYKEKMFCYIWFDKKTRQPYIAMYPARKLRHPKLISGNRTQSKILVINPEKDLPVKTIREVFRKAVNLL